MSEAEMFKQMETGKLLAEDVLPKVAKEYARVARENGALGKAQQKVNSQYQRFLNALTDIKIAMFEGGFGKGLADSFKTLAEFMRDNMQGFAAFGQSLGMAIQTAVRLLNVALAPIMTVVKAFNSMFGDSGAKIIGVVAAVATLTRGVALLASAFALANLGFMALVRNIAKYGVITTAALAVEDIYVGSRGGNAYSKDWGITSTLDQMAASRLGQFITSPVRAARTLASGENPFTVNINVNDSEMSRVITATVDKRNEENIANVMSTSGG